MFSGKVVQKTRMSAASGNQSFSSPGGKNVKLFKIILSNDFTKETCRQTCHSEEQRFVAVISKFHRKYSGQEKHRHAKRARVIFLVIGVCVELFTVMIWFSFFGLRCTARRKLEIYNL